MPKTKIKLDFVLVQRNMFKADRPFTLGRFCGLADESDICTGVFALDRFICKHIIEILRLFCVKSKI